MTNASSEFGVSLDACIQNSGLPVAEVAEAADLHSSTVYDYIRGAVPKRTTLVKLVRALGLDSVDAERLFRLAGQEMPKGLHLRKAGDFSTAELLDMLRRRFAELEAGSAQRSAAELRLPPGELKPAQFRTRGHSVTRLHTLAGEASKAGDDIAAAAIAELHGLLKAQLDAAVKAAAATGSLTPGPQ